MVAMTVSAHPAAAPTDLLSPQACRLWNAYQSAAGVLGESLRDLGFIDLVVYGRQTTGKSSLLGALCGIQLPTGENQITKCPIRITVSPSQQGATLTAAGNPPQTLDSCNLTPELYKTALDVLSKSRVTHQEMTVCLGSKDHPPLTLVDLPGLIPNTADTASMDVERMVKDMLQNPATMPIIVLRAESDELATVRTELTGGRKFYAVATHLDLYDPERDVGRLVDLAVKFRDIGCMGLFLVSVKGSTDRPQGWYDEFCSRCPDAALRERLRAMCGVGALRARLQEVQLEHMLQSHPAITANLTRSLHQVDAMQRAAPKDEEALEGTLNQAIGQMAQDLSDSVERGAWSMGSDEHVAHVSHRLRDRAHQVLREFGHRAEEQAMQSLVDAWQVVDPEMVNSTSLLSGEQGLVMNLLKPGLVKLRHEAQAAAVQLLAQQKSFLLWRAEKHLGHLGALVMHAFATFVDAYHAEKTAALDQILDHADEAFKVVTPDVYAPAIYHAMLADAKTVDTIERYSKPLAAALAVTQPLTSNGQAMEESFVKAWVSMQRKSKLLAFQLATQTVNTLASQMWLLIFVRSCRWMTMQPWQTSLAFVPLQPAFTRWVESEGHDLKAWVDPEQEALSAKHAALTAILAELKPFEMRSATLSQAPLKPVNADVQTPSSKARRNGKKSLPRSFDLAGTTHVMADGNGFPAEAQADGHANGHSNGTGNGHSHAHPYLNGNGNGAGYAGQEYFEAPQMVDMGSRSSSNPNSMAGEPGGPRKKSSGLLTKLGMKGRNGSSLLATGEL